MPSKILSQLASLLNPAPAPKDFDPESIDEPKSDKDENDTSDDEDAESDNENAGREHYVPVGKSRLRKDEDLHLDPKYSGAKISRATMYDSEDEEMSDADEEDVDGEDDDDEEEYGDEDMEDDLFDSEEASDNGGVKLSNGAPKATVKNGTNDKKKPLATVEDMNSEDENDDEEEDDEEGSEEDNSDNSELSGLDEDDDDDEDSEDDDVDDRKKEEAARRAELKKLMADEQKNVVANLSSAARADAEKGLAVRDQRAAFDSFLNSRIKLQKAIISINSLPSAVPTETPSFKAAEEAALSLFNTISNLRHDILHAREANSKKRKHSDIVFTTPLSEAWTSLQGLESASAPFRTHTLEKWSSKLQSTNAASIPLAKKLNQSTAPTTIASQLREHLTDTPRLISRTRIPRASAPIQLAANTVENIEIYDDTDFYQQLLKVLVDQRMVDTEAGMDVASWIPAEVSMKKVKKQVDTRASKGRKLRYHVHEKLQNFMTPDDGVLEWSEQQVDELFSSLLGQRLQVREEDSDEEDQDVIDESLPALRLFSSTIVA